MVFRPVAALLQCASLRGIRLINRMLGHAARGRLSTLNELDRRAGRPNAERDGIAIDVFGLGLREYVGDSHVWSWYRGSSVGPYPCVIALLALEIGLDASVKQGLTLREPARAVLDGATTLASVGLIFGFFVRHIEDVTDELDPFLATPALWQLEIARASSEGHLHVQGRDPDALANVDRRRWLLVDVAATIAVTSNGKGQGTTFTVRLSTIDDEHAAPLSDSRDTADRCLHRRAVE